MLSRRPDRAPSFRNFADLRATASLAATIGTPSVRIIVRAPRKRWFCGERPEMMADLSNQPQYEARLDADSFLSVRLP